MNTASTRNNATRSGVRLTLRGRLVLALAGTFVFLFGWITIGSGSADASVDSAAAAGEFVVVQPGESLWSIATDIAPHSDPREVILRIREMNDLGANHVYPGQSLAVPAL